MEYLSQPFKLNNSGLESTITVSMRLVFMKVCDGEKTTLGQEEIISSSINQVHIAILATNTIHYPSLNICAKLLQQIFFIFKFDLFFAAKYSGTIRGKNSRCTTY